MKKPMGRLPEFLCIGAHKGATTWLFRNLHCHREVCIPSKKGLHYFDDRKLSYFEVLGRLSSERAFTTQFTRDLLGLRWRQVSWNARYAFLPRTDAWYASLFSGCGDRKRGDVTPAYSILDASEVAHVAQLMPAAKIVLILRNPIERAWSHARMDFSKGSWPFLEYAGLAFEELPLEVMQRHFDSEFSTLRGDYARILANWRQHFSEEQIFIGYLEEIESQPLAFLNRLAAFLEIEPLDKGGWLFAERRVHAQDPLDMTEQAARFLSRRYVARLRALEVCSPLPGREFVTAWREFAERHL